MAIDSLDQLFAENDYIIHLGDTSSDGGYIRGKYPEKTYVVNGNCDLDKLGEDEIVLEIEGVRIFACHGHKYSVKYTHSKLLERARELNCSIALYGHTHRADIDEEGDVTLINPGCMTRYSQKSYLYLVLNNKKATYKIVEI
jgi:putative phosphoesterase